MEPALRRAIGGDVFVTVHAEFSLLVAIERDVAGPAFRFNVRMTGYHFARHDQRFQLRLCDVETERANHKYESGE